MILFCGGLAAAALGCGDSGPSYEIASGTLSGKINGTSWKFVSGQTDSFLSDDKGFFTTLYGEKVDSCGIATGAMDIVLLDVPKTVGDYDFGLTQNATLAHGSDNKVAVTGLLTVEKITDTTVEAGLYAIVDDDPDNEVSGHFTDTICAATP